MQLGILQKTTETMKRKPLTIQEHREIADLLRDKRFSPYICNIMNKCGRSSRAGRYASKLSEVLMHLKSDLENDLATHHPEADHTGIYYHIERP